MGLDMYLEAEFFLSKFGEEDENKQREGLRQQFGVEDTGNLNYVKVVFEVAYWRKANQIHKWFVDNVQDGVDNCATYYVSHETLKELLAVVEEVLSSGDFETAMELLPPQEGFFFGGSELNEWYWQDLEETKEMLTKILNNKALEKANFQYQSSW